MSFLKAEWRKLAIANYVVDPKVLEPHVPPGTELDLFCGKCYVSLVGFMFLNTKLRGLTIPFHTNFEEVNLRFYVKRKEGEEIKRGVVFIKELVPKAAITLVANTIYREHYETLPMNHNWKEGRSQLSVEYSWKKRGKWNRFQVVGYNRAKPIPEGCETEFITEHYWGYAKYSEGKTNEYEVTHPKWNAYEVKESFIEVDFATVYGHEFGFLNELQPDSVKLAEGSEITVERKIRLNL